MCCARAWRASPRDVYKRQILREVKPDLVIGAGGYVSGPVVQAAARRGIRTAIHEQNADVYKRQLFSRMVLAGCTFAVMEASSQALDQLRLWGLRCV